jgi:hypothetical protein
VLGIARVNLWRGCDMAAAVLVISMAAAVRAGLCCVAAAARPKREG